MQYVGFFLFVEPVIGIRGEDSGNPVQALEDESVLVVDEVVVQRPLDVERIRVEPHAGEKQASWITSGIYTLSISELG
jgi:hypothetical protein